MTLDKNLFSDEQVVTASAASTNEVEFPDAGNVGDGQSVRLYVQAVTNIYGTGAAEIFAVTCEDEDAGGGDLDGDYFIFSTPDTDYYVWFNTGASADPEVADRTGVEVSVSTSDAAADVADAVATAINALSDASAKAEGAVVTVTPAKKGACTDAADGDTGWAGFSIWEPGVDPTTLQIHLQHGRDGSSYRTVLSSRVWQEGDSGTDPTLIALAGTVLFEASVPKDMMDFHQVYYEVNNALTTTPANKFSAGYMPVP